jgi:CspA family cold shock protein
VFESSILKKEEINEDEPQIIIDQKESLKKEEQRLKDREAKLGEKEQRLKEEEKRLKEVKIGNSDNEKKKKRLNGTVKWYNDGIGYGFIKREDNEKDIFVHSSALQDSAIEHLEKGEQLTFEIDYTDNGQTQLNTKTTPKLNSTP